MSTAEIQQLCFEIDNKAALTMSTNLNTDGSPANPLVASALWQAYLSSPNADSCGSCM